MNRFSEPTRLPLRPARRFAILRALLYLLAAALSVYALRGVPLNDIWRALQGLSLAQIVLLLLINALVMLSMTTRWWLVARAEQPRLPFLPFIAYRLAVFGVSYFTPGPQVGGEPLQVLYLRRHGTSFARAVSVVIIDKLLELLGNFIFIAIGLFAFRRLDLFTYSSLPLSASIAFLLLLLLLWPPVHVLLLYHGEQPATALMRTILPRFGRKKWFRLIAASERMAASFTRRHSTAFFGALVAAMLTWASMAAEYLLMLSFLGMHLPLEAALASLTASLLAFLIPLPGGLGALESSQVLALGAFGYPGAFAISLTLLMRLRDFLNGGLGLLIASCLMQPKTSSLLPRPSAPNP